MGKNPLSSYLNVCFTFRLMESLNSIDLVWEGQGPQIVLFVKQNQKEKKFKDDWFCICETSLGWKIESQRFEVIPLGF